MSKQSCYEEDEWVEVTSPGSPLTPRVDTDTVTSEYEAERVAVKAAAQLELAARVLLGPAEEEKMRERMAGAKVELVDTDGDKTEYRWDGKDLVVWCNGEQEQSITMITYYPETRVLEDATGQLEMPEDTCDAVVAELRALCGPVGVAFMVEAAAGGPVGPLASGTLAARALAGPSKVTFTLNGKSVTVKRPDPTQSLLDYLRYDVGLTGTKGSCRQGGCGACTVLMSGLGINAA